jgi:hypothetical protein
MNTFYEESLACIYVPKDKGQYIVFKGIESQLLLAGVPGRRSRRQTLTHSFDIDILFLAMPNNGMAVCLRPA